MLCVRHIRGSLSGLIFFESPKEAMTFCFPASGLLKLEPHHRTGRFREPEAVLRCFKSYRSPAPSSVYALQFFAANHRLCFTSALWHVSGNGLIESKLDWGSGRKSQRHYDEHVHVTIPLHPPITFHESTRNETKGGNTKRVNAEASTEG
jgi:hypothetical protein